MTQVLFLPDGCQAAVRVDRIESIYIDYASDAEDVQDYKVSFDTFAGESFTYESDLTLEAAQNLLADLMQKLGWVPLKPSNGAGGIYAPIP